MKTELTQFIREKPELAKELLMTFCGIGNRRGISEWIDTHAKQPILTTEDGVEVYQDDKMLYCIKKDDWVFYSTKVDTEYMRECFIHFSTPEARTAYIIQNKPLTSVKEQVNAILQLKYGDEPYSFTLDQVEKFEEVLTELAKKKMV